MRLLLFVAVSVATLATSTFAQAGILIEPYLAYASLKDSGTLTIPTLSATPFEIEESTTKGSMFGARLGYEIGMIGLGVDYAGGTLSSDGDEFKTTNMGAFISVDLPVIRAYVSYFAKAESDAEADAPVNTIKMTGAGMRAGVGFTILPLVSLNLEYYTLTYDEVENDIVTAVDYKLKGAGASISIPFSF